MVVDGAIKKKIIRAGHGEIPPKGSKVKVHYTGTLSSDGSKFDSSRDRKEPFEFELGNGSVIKAWDEGVATMKVGERAILTCREDFAYGKEGSPPKIPGGATLVFDIDLLSFSENEEDLTDDGGVMKKIIKKGVEYKTPNDTATCVVKYTGIVNGKVFTTQNADTEVHLNMDEDFTIPTGLHRALQSMKKGEKASFTVKSNYGYGKQGNSQLGIPPGADIVYTIELISFKNEKESWEMNTKEKIASMMKRKIKGNKLYGIKQYSKSSDCYEKAIKMFRKSELKDLSNDEKKEINAIQVACHSNTALCKLKEKKFTEAIESCNKALDLQENHAKSLYRRGQAHAYNSDDEAALVDLKAAKKIQPGDKAIQRYIDIVRKRVRKHKNKEKKLYADMFKKATFTSDTENKKKDDKKEDKEKEDTKKNTNGSKDSNQTEDDKKEEHKTKIDTKDDSKKEKNKKNESKKEITKKKHDKKEKHKTEDETEDEIDGGWRPLFDIINYLIQIMVTNFFQSQISTAVL